MKESLEHLDDLLLGIDADINRVFDQLERLEDDLNHSQKQILGVAALLLNSIKRGASQAQAQVETLIERDAVLIEAARMHLERATDAMVVLVPRGKKEAE